MPDKKGSTDDKALHCSFCNKSQHEVRKLIAGPSVFICDECIDLCNDIIIAESQEAARDAISNERHTHEEIKSFLNGYVIGQDTQIGRGSGREGVGQDVEISGSGTTRKKQKTKKT